MYSPSGAVDGFLLDNGAEVRFPPHEAETAVSILTEGSTVEPAGIWHVGRRGHQDLRAQMITNLDTRAVVAIGAVAPPPASAMPPVVAVPPADALPPASAVLPTDGAPPAPDSGSPLPANGGPASPPAAAPLAPLDAEQP